jgi:hypothetical protein
MSLLLLLLLLLLLHLLLLLLFVNLNGEDKNYIRPKTFSVELPIPNFAEIRLTTLEIKCEEERKCHPHNTLILCTLCKECTKSVHFDLCKFKDKSSPVPEHYVMYAVAMNVEPSTRDILGIGINQTLTNTIWEVSEFVGNSFL